MNKSIMIGRLVRDPEVNYTTKKDGDEFIVANFRIAVDRKYSDETDFSHVRHSDGWQNS